MKINISKSVFELMEELDQDLMDDVILKAIELLKRGKSPQIIDKSNR